MQSATSETGCESLRAAFDTIRKRPCRLCGTSPDGVFARCTARYGKVGPLLVIARGPGNELALAEVAWDGDGEVGCVNPEALYLVRPPALSAADAATEDAVRTAGGELRIASGFNDPQVKRTVCRSAMATTWQVAGVYPLVESGVLRETPRPLRTLAHSNAPAYGRWPAPWMPWVSVCDVVPWTELPFRQRVRRGKEGLPCDAFAAAGLPPVSIDAHPIVKALVLAALLRCVPWQSDGKSLGARLLPPPPADVAIVGVYQGHVYRLGCDGQYERLFADCDDVRAVGVREIELAAGHMRIADQCNGVTARKGVNDDAPVSDGAHDNRASACERKG